MMRRHVFVTAVVHFVKRGPGAILGLVLLQLVGVWGCVAALRRSVEEQRRRRLSFALAQCGQADEHENDHRPPGTGHGQ